MTIYSIIVIHSLMGCLKTLAVIGPVIDAFCNTVRIACLASSLSHGHTNRIQYTVRTSGGSVGRSVSSGSFRIELTLV